MLFWRTASLCRFARLSRFQTCRLVNSTTSTNAVNESTVPPTPENGKGAQEKDLSEQIKALQSEHKHLLSVNEELEDKYKRCLADTDNVRKRLMRQIDDAKIFGIQSFCKDLLEIADILSKATSSISEDEVKSAKDPKFVNLHEGLKMTEKHLMNVFARHHLVRICPDEGDLFDPNIHEALFQAPLKEGKKHNTIASVTKVGYKLHERTLRPAYVGVFGP